VPAVSSSRDEEPVSSSSASSPSSASTGASTTPTISSSSSDVVGEFTLRDRRVIRNCVSDHASDFPENVTHRAELPSGDERNLHLDSTVPAAMVKDFHPLPIACLNQLPKFPRNQDRVLYAGHVLLVERNNRILDMFDLKTRNSREAGSN